MKFPEHPCRSASMGDVDMQRVADVGLEAFPGGVFPVALGGCL